MLIELFWLLSTLINLVIFVLFAWVIMSWLVSFDVINTRNPFVATLYRILNQLTAPMLRPIQRVLPTFGGLDLSPLVVIVVVGAVAADAVALVLGIGLLFLERILFRIIFGVSLPV